MSPRTAQCRLGHTPITKHTRRQSRVGWLIALTGLVLGVFLSELDLPVDAGAVAVLGFAPLIVAMERRYFPGLLIGPILLMYLYHVLGYGLGPMWQLHVNGWMFNLYTEGLVQAQWGGVIGLLTFALVFPFVFNRVSRWTQPKDVAPASDQPKWAFYTLLLLALVGAGIIYGFRTGAYNRLGGLTSGIGQDSLMSVVNPLHYALFFFLGYFATRPGLRWKTIWVTTFIAYSIFHFLDGGRGAAAFAMIFSGIGLVWGGVPRRAVLLAGLGGFLLIVPISGIVLEYRGQTSNAGTDLEMRMERIISATEESSDTRSDSLASATAAFTRGVTVAFVDRVFLLTPSVIPFAGLDGLENAIYAITPSIINPNRPDLNDGNLLAIQYGAISPRGNYMPAVGDGYRRGGWLGVALLYAFITTIFASAWAVTWQRIHKREWLAMFMFLIFQSGGFWSTTGLGALVLVLWTFPRTFLTFWLISRAQDILVELTALREAPRVQRRV